MKVSRCPLPDKDLSWFGPGVVEKVAVVGMGQLGCVLSEGLLKSGRTVIPVLRGRSLITTSETQRPDLVLIATGEDDQEAALAEVPPYLADAVVLIQNELRPDQWLAHGVSSPTVGIIWFEKRAGMVPHEVLPSVVSGPHAPVLGEAIEQVGLGFRHVDDIFELAHQLIVKNLYILSLNLTGLVHRGRACDLLDVHRQTFEKVRDDLIEFETAMLRSAGGVYATIPVERERLIADLKRAIEADPHHGCAGRSARRRLERTLIHADRLGLPVPHLRALGETAR